MRRREPVTPDPIVFGPPACIACGMRPVAQGCKHQRCEMCAAPAREVLKAAALSRLRRSGGAR